MTLAFPRDIFVSLYLLWCLLVIDHAFDASDCPEPTREAESMNTNGKTQDDNDSRRSHTHSPCKYLTTYSRVKPCHDSRRLGLSRLTRTDQRRPEVRNLPRKRDIECV